MTSQAGSAAAGAGEAAVRFEASGLAWCAEPGDAELLRREVALRLDQLERLPGAALLKRNLVRTVLRVPLSDGRCVIVKRYRVAGLEQFFKYLVRPSRARTEWQVGRAIEQAGIATSVPLAFAERRRGPVLRDAALIAREIRESSRLDAFLARLPAGPERDTVLDQLARLLRCLHDAGFAHRDFHAGNLLVTGTPAVARLHVIDLHSVTHSARASERARWQDLVKLLHSLRAFSTPAERLRIAERYAQAAAPRTRLGTLVASGRLAPRLDAALERLERARVKSRTARCLVRSSKFEISRVAGCRVHHLRSVAAAEAVALASADSPRGRLGERAARVVHFSGPRWARRLVRRRARAAWVEANGLRVRGFDAPEPLSLVLPGRGAQLRDACLVVEDRGDA